jgi:hypothetical protein
MQREEDSDKEEFTAASCTSNQTFWSKSGMQ